MVEIFTDNAGEYKIVYGYRIFKLEDEDIFDYVRLVYSDNNKWRKSNVLTDAFIDRVKLKDVLNYLDVSRSVLEGALQEEFSNSMAIDDAIESVENRAFIKISLPTSVVAYSRNGVEGIRGYKNSFLPLIVMVNGTDYSRWFQDFSDYKENAAIEAYEVFKQENYPADLKDTEKMELALIENIEEREELGLK